MAAANQQEKPKKQLKLGTRATRQRAAVISALEQMPNFVSVKDIHLELQRRQISVGLTTIYRTLQALVDLGVVDSLHMTNGETLYRHCHANGHHHHLVCTNCGRTVEVDGGPVEEWANSLAEAAGFVVTNHVAEIFGLCSSCQPTAQPANPAETKIAYNPNPRSASKLPPELDADLTKFSQNVAANEGRTTGQATPVEHNYQIFSGLNPYAAEDRG